jgi:hypothetical protein
MSYISDVSSNDVQVVLARPENGRELDDIVCSTPASLIYYTAAYRAFLGRVLPGVESAVLVARTSGRIAGFLPVCIASDPHDGSVANSQPFFGSHGGALVRPDLVEEGAIRVSLCVALAELMKERRIAALTIVENPLRPLDDAEQRALGTTVVDHRIGQFTRLPAAGASVEDELFAILHKNTRTAVRKGRKAGLHVTCAADDETVSWFHRVHEWSIAALGGVPKPLGVFKALFDVFGPLGQIRLYVGRRGGERVCGLLVLLHRDVVEYYTPVVVGDHRESQALSALIVDVMIALANEGYRLWNWGGTWPSQAGVYRFKSRWGAEERPYRYHALIVNPEITRIGRDAILTRFPFFYVYKFA